MVNVWRMGEVTGARKDGTPLKGVNLIKVKAVGHVPRNKADEPDCWY
jgi:hypothetical protein